MKTSVILSDGTFPCSTAPLQGGYEQVFRRAAEIGFDAVQLTVNRPEEVDAKLIRRLGKQYGLSVSALATGLGYTADGLSMGAGNEDVRRRAVERMRGHVDLAKELGSAMVIIGAIRGRYSDAGGAEEYFRSFHRSVDEVLDYARQKEIVLILEANDHFETDAYITTRDTAQYIRSLGSPFLKLQLDTMHMLYEKEDIRRSIVDCADIAAQMDISGEDRSCPGPGKYDYPLVIQSLKEIDFQGYLTFEYRPAPPEDAAKTGYDYIRGLIDR